MKSATPFLRTTVLFLLACVFGAVSMPAQTEPVDFASQKIKHLCRVWGLAKYYHPRIAECELSWDDVLLRKYPQIKAATDDESLRAQLLALLDVVGDIPDPNNDPDEFTEEQSMLYDMAWVEEEFYSGELGQRMRRLRDFARIRQHCLVGAESGTSKPVFYADDRYFDFLDPYPPEDLRVLALCRYWNAFLYFSPYRDILDTDWHTVLERHARDWVEAPDTLAYHIAVYKTALETCDSHSGISSSYLSAYFGNFMAPFMLKRIGDAFVVVRTIVPNIRKGDVVLAVDDIPIAALIDSLGPLCDKTNPQAHDYVLGYRIARGPEGPSRIVLEDGSGVRTEPFTRNSTNGAVVYHTEYPVHFDTLLENGARIGYIDLVHLEKTDVRAVMTAHRYNDAIIFDVRGYPRGSIYELASFLLPKKVPVADFSAADTYFPGMLEWHMVWMGGNGDWLYEGPIFALFDESAISHAEYTCMILDAAPRCIKIGSPTRGSDGNVTWVDVPGQRITFTGLGTFYPDRTPTQRVGIQPDIFVRPTVEGLRAGRDELLEAALAAFKVLDVRDAAVPVQPGLTLYPSPARDVLHCGLGGRSGSWMLEIHDVLGRTVCRERHDISGSGAVRIRVAHLPPGAYLLRAVPASGNEAPLVSRFIRR